MADNIWLTGSKIWIRRTVRTREDGTNYIIFYKQEAEVIRGKGGMYYYTKESY